MSTFDIVATASVIVLVAAVAWLIWDGDSRKMKLTIKNDIKTLYVDNQRFSLVGVGDGSTDFEHGTWPVTVQYSEVFKCDMVNAQGLGWIGANLGCTVVLGNVRGRHTVLADILAQERLRDIVSRALGDGKRVYLEVE